MDQQIGQCDALGRWRTSPWLGLGLLCGVLFATGVTLFLIPCAYLVNEDFKAGVARAWQWYTSPFRSRDEESPPEAPPIGK